jgi:hypothetical protein
MCAIEKTVDSETRNLYLTTLRTRPKGTGHILRPPKPCFQKFQKAKAHIPALAEILRNSSTEGFAVGWYVTEPTPCEHFHEAGKHTAEPRGLMGRVDLTFTIWMGGRVNVRWVCCGCCLVAVVH